MPNLTPSELQAGANKIRAAGHIGPIEIAVETPSGFRDVGELAAINRPHPPMWEVSYRRIDGSYYTTEPFSDCDWFKIVNPFWCPAPAAPKQIDLSRYPQQCPKCKGPAYIGFNLIDCSKCP